MISTFQCSLNLENSITIFMFWLNYRVNTRNVVRQIIKSCYTVDICLGDLELFYSGQRKYGSLTCSILFCFIFEPFSWKLCKRKAAHRHKECLDLEQFIFILLPRDFFCKNICLLTLRTQGKLPLAIVCFWFSGRGLLSSLILNLDSLCNLSSASTKIQICGLCSCCYCTWNGTNLTHCCAAQRCG